MTDQEAANLVRAKEKVWLAWKAIHAEQMERVRQQVRQEWAAKRYQIECSIGRLN